jgi:hypothetical protein
MSDTMYNVQHYLKFTADEFISIIVTSFFSSFVLTFDEWGDTSFELMAGVRAWIFMFLCILLILLVSIWVCKSIAIKTGYVITYNAHIVGLLFGVFICVASAGYLPLFLPGGFSVDQPQRLKIGKWHAHYRQWEMGLIAGTFSLVMILWVMIFNPLFLITRDPIWLHLIIACCLFALFALIPAPFFSIHQKGRIRDWWRYLQGSTFGLELLYVSKAWYVTLAVAVIIFSTLAYLLTTNSVGVGIWLYVISLLLGFITMVVYVKFFDYNV